jgi:hypothetical protein
MPMLHAHPLRRCSMRPVRLMPPEAGPNTALFFGGDDAAWELIGEGGSPPPLPTPHALPAALAA